MRLPASLLFLPFAAAISADFPAPRWLGDPAQNPIGARIQRTMRLLDESTPERPNTVRILFYGQSITEQAWWKTVAADLRSRFPHADLIIENRAIGGHSSQLLIKTAEADLYPFQPDLLIFHVYGAHDQYEAILRRVRERTTAEILQQNDHLTKPEHFDEETDPTKLAPGKGTWDAFMNHAWLPGLSKKYQTQWCDQRAVWKRYLRDHQLEPKALLRDSVHLNPHGEFLMAEAVKAHLHRAPQYDPSPAEAWVKTLDAGKHFTPRNRRIELDFDGSRIDAIAAPGGQVNVTIDGKAPSQTSGSIRFTRTTHYPRTNWPCILQVQTSGQPIPEDWTLTLRGTGADDPAAIEFDLQGSITGPDGSGRVGQRFTSKSARIVIEPDDWNLAYCYKVHGRRLEDGFTIQWRAQFLGHDTLPADAQNTQSHRPITLVQGIPRGPHRLVLEGAVDRIRTLLVHRPPLP
jgi:hypothetical protein